MTYRNLRNKVYGLKRFKRGVLITITLTTKCNLKCSYCSQDFIQGKKPNHKETSFFGWVRFIKRFPYKIKEVYVTGGEPTLHKDFVRIIKFLLGEGYYVKIFTNLTEPDVISKLPKSRRLMVETTFHEGVHIDYFTSAYDFLKDYNILVNEIGKKELSFSKKIRLKTKETSINYNDKMIRVSANKRMNLNCFDKNLDKLDYEND